MRLSTFTKNKHHGFTIVELLIVIVIIATLAAITIVAYNGIQQRARVSRTNAALTQAKKKLELYKVDNSSYPTSGNLSAAGLTDSDVTYQYTSDGTTYCLTATATNVSYKATDTTSPTTGGCAGHGQGGVAAVTNLAMNPKLASNATYWSTLCSSGCSSSGSRVSITTPPVAGINYTYRGFYTGTPATWWRLQMGSIPVTAGRTYTYTAWLKPSVTAPTGLIIIWRNSSNATISEGVGAFSSQTANTWQQRSVTAIAPSGAVTALLHMGGSAGGADGATMDGTGLMFTEGSSTYNYADGDSTDWVWNGTANSSTSTGPPL